MMKPSKIVTTLLITGSFTLLTGCSQNIGSMSLAPKHTEDSSGFALTLSKKEVGQTIQELQQDVQSRQSYTGRFSNQ